VQTPEPDAGAQHHTAGDARGTPGIGT
jgi:hypothetical protein